MRKFILIILIWICPLSYVSCSDDEDPDYDILNASFLEVYNETKWIVTWDTGIAVIKFNNNPLKYIENWLILRNGECYTYYYVNNFYNSGTFEVLENSNKRLVINISDDGKSYLVFTIKNNSLKILHKSEDAGDSSTIYIKTTKDIEALPECEDNFG